MSDYTDPKKFYDEYGRKEDSRLRKDSFLHNKLEFERTIKYMSKVLPDSGHILDAAGASGRYAEWLLERGYTVTLLDLSRTQSILAKENLKNEYPSEFQIIQGDISKMSLDKNVFDGVLCLGGGLSHLIRKEKRKDALEEFKRVSKSNSPICISVMGLLNVLRQLTVIAEEHDETDILEGLAKDGRYSPERIESLSVNTGFTQCKFYRARELKESLEEVDFTVLDIVGLESISSSFSHRKPENLTETQEVNIRNAVDELGNDMSIADMSAHILAVSRV